MDAGLAAGRLWQSRPCAIRAHKPTPNQAQGSFPRQLKLICGAPAPAWHSCPVPALLPPALPRDLGMSPPRARLGWGPPVPPHLGSPGMSPTTEGQPGGRGQHQFQLGSTWASGVRMQALTPCRAGDLQVTRKIGHCLLQVLLLGNTAGRTESTRKRGREGEWHQQDEAL